MPNEITSLPTALKEIGLKFRTIILSPGEYFQNFPLDEDWKEPAKFYGIVAGVNIALSTLFQIAHPATLLGVLTASVIGQIIWLLLFAGILHGLAKLIGGTGTLSEMLRASAYCNAPAILGWMPFINVFMWLYAFYMGRLALERVHQLPGNRAALVATAAGVIVIGIAALIFVFSIAAVVKKGTTGGM